MAKKISMDVNQIMELWSGLSLSLARAVPGKELPKDEHPDKERIGVVVLDDDVARILNVITAAARTGEMSDGKVFVLSVKNAVRVRTGEEGDSAI